MSQPLRLESIGDFLQKLIDHYRRNLRLVAEILLIPSVIVTISGLWIERLAERLAAVAELTDPAERLAQMALPSLEVLAYGVAIAIIQCLSLGAVAAAVQEMQRGGSVSVFGAWSRAARHLAGIVTIGAGYPIVSIVGTAVISTVILIPLILLAAVSGLSFLVLLGIPFVIGCAIVIPLLLMRFSLAIPAMIGEKSGIVLSCRRSASLTRGNRLFLIIVLLIGLLAANVVAFIFQGPFLAARWMAGDGSLATPLHVGQAIAGTVGSALGMPFPMLVLCLLYVELRNKEQILTIGVS